MLQLDTVQKIMAVYYRATAGKVSVYDHKYRQVSELSDKDGVEQKVCRYCPLYQAEAPLANVSLCHRMHVNAIKESSACGSTQLYVCEMGLVFWSSPVFYDGIFAGALVGSGYRSSGSLPEGREMTEYFIKQRKKLPQGDGEKLKSLAEMLLLCTVSLSRGSENCHEDIRRRNIQQYKRHGEQTRTLPPQHQHVLFQR